MGYFRGFAVTFRKLWEKRVTVAYPEKKSVKPERLHGRHVLNRYEDGMEKCIGCELCAGVCPANCIYVRGSDNSPLPFATVLVAESPLFAKYTRLTRATGFGPRNDRPNRDTVYSGRYESVGHLG